MLTDEQLKNALRDLASQKVKQAFVRPTAGIDHAVLSPEWFRLWKVALAEAERLDMNLWIYDENSYPSGFPGGWVPELIPKSRGRGLCVREVNHLNKPTDDVLAVYRIAGSEAQDVTREVRAEEAMPEGDYLVVTVQRAWNNPRCGNRCYVDLLYPGVTETFLEVTHEAYRRAVGDQFGNRIPGSFTDEPNIHSAPMAHCLDRWAARGVPEALGISLMDNLASMFRPVGDWKRVRHDFFQLALEQFIEHWSKPYHNYCQKYGLEWTGHYFDHEWPNCLMGPDNMAMYTWHQRSAIDCLKNQYHEDTHAQFGNLRMVKELGSVANQLGTNSRCARLMASAVGICESRT